MGKFSNGVTIPDGTITKLFGANSADEGVVQSVDGVLGNLSRRFYVSAPTDAAIRATITKALSLGGGIIMLPAGNITLTAPLPANSLLAYEGLRPDMTYGVIADNPWTFSTDNVGTVLVGDGTFPAIAGNNVAAADYPTDGTTAETQAMGLAFGNAALKGFSVYNIGFDTFSRALDLGAKNVAGVMYGSITDIFVRNCSDWGVNLVNTFHTEVNNIWICCDKATGIGHGFRMAIDLWPGILIPGNLPVGNIYVYQGNLTKRGIVFEAVGQSKMNQVTTVGRLQCNRFGGDSISIAATMTNASTAVGVGDTSKFPPGMPVTFSATANGFTAGRIYIVRSRSVSTGSGTITLSDRIEPLYISGVVSSGAEIAATGATAVNIQTNGFPNLEIIAGGGSAAVGSGLVVHSKFTHLDLEGNATTSLYIENLSNSVVELIETTGASLCGVAVRKASYCHLSATKEAITDIASDSATLMVHGAIKTARNYRGVGVQYDWTDDRSYLHLVSADGVPNIAALFLPGGSLIQFNKAVTKRVAGAVAGTITLDAGRAGVLPINSGTSIFTLPTITNVSNKTSMIGLGFELVSLGSAVTINTDGVQTFNGISGKTSIVIPAGGSVQLCAINSGSSYYWAILGGLGVDTVRSAQTYDPASIAVGGHSLQTYTVAGAQLGDAVEVAVSVDQQGLILNAYVSATNTVAVDYANPPWAAGAIDLASHSLYITVRRRL